ncbi:glycosyltransferase family 4 protein [Bacillus sp. JJ1474]|uniref:glycosyltransferase family 4 protein n=3 Tax=unclassified Bacillus (in: firmicutes) TaxID=185979 RepID=UPI002FFE908A
MKILYVTTISNTVNAFLIPHIRMLIAQGHQVDVAFNIVQEVSHELINMGCKIHQIEFQRSPLKRENLLAYKKVKNLVIREGYDLVHTHTPVASFLIRMACRNIPNLKMIYTAHGFHFFKGAPLQNWLLYYPIEWISAKWTDVLITINQEDYLSAKKFMNGDIYNVHGVGVDLNKFQPQSQELKQQLRKEYGYKSDDFIIIFAGDLRYEKHQDLLIDTISLLRHKIPNIKLLLAGSGQLLEQYRKQVIKLEIEENVEFLGYRTDINKLLLLSDIAVSSSKREGLPVNVMEAMATGLPLIVTNCRGNRDLVENGVNGFIREINDISGFAESIDILYHSELLRNSFALESLERIRQYSLKNVLKEMEYCYVCHNKINIE